ncbi:MAG: DMT family transporter [Hyphomicrobiaceae bacterium]
MASMSLVAFGVAAALLSAATQAVAHALLKSGRDKLIIRGVIGATGAVVALPLSLVVGPPSVDLVRWLVLSSVVHACYQLVLIRAYDQLDFSLAYPMARGVAPLAISVLGVVFLAERMSLTAVAGICIVTSGLLSLAFSRAPHSGGVGAAITAGLLTTTYTLIDAEAVRLADEAARFIVWFFVSDGLLMSFIAICARRRRTANLVRCEGLKGVAAGLASLVTYGCALLALRHLPAGAVAALRETSVVFGALIAISFLRESLTPRRLVGTSVIAAGGILCAIGVGHS